MSKVFRDAVAEAATLPESVQEKIGEELRAYIERLRRLRGDIEQGMRSLDRGGGRSLDIGEVIRRAHEKHGES